jgi:diphosphomevalonate decarboxylase
VRSCLELFRERLPGVPHAEVASTNSFPTGAGLASSASGFAALVVAADHALGARFGQAQLAELARRCSGSAARSLFGGFVELRLRPDGAGTDTAPILEAAGWPLQVVVAVTSAEGKAIGSTAGMLHTERTAVLPGLAGDAGGRPGVGDGRSRTATWTRWPRSPTQLPQDTRSARLPAGLY